MSLVKQAPPWFHMIDEFAQHPDQMAWYDVTGLRMTPQRQFEGVVWLVKRGLVRPAGYRVRELLEDIYAITPEGREFWEQNVKGRRSRPKTASSPPRWSTAQIAAAVGPRDVWSMSVVPWRWSFAAERAAEAALQLKGVV
jgi:hypothetical protein